MSTIFRVAPSWPGFSGVENLIIFGDSYSSVGYEGNEADHPTASNPLGVPYPGLTWNEPDLPNWVGHLITKFCPPPRYDPNAEEGQEVAGYTDSPLLVYDYARGGDTIAGVRRQIQEQFLKKVGQKPSWAPWAANNSLFVTWVGINDCAYSSQHQSTLETLFKLQDELYEAGARNFLFIDVPPIHRSPAVPEHRQNSASFDNWNTSLRVGAKKFSDAHDDATVLLFSSFRAFETFLDDPEVNGFEKKDIRKWGGSVWVDHIHPSSQVHEFIASHVADHSLPL